MAHKLKSKLDFHYTNFDRTTIAPDPLQFLHQYRAKEDIEIVGFISSIFAYGNVSQINLILSKIFSELGTSPYQKILGMNESEIKIFTNKIRYRFYTPQDVEELFLTLQKILSENFSLKNIFLERYKSSDKNIKTALSHFSEQILNYFPTKTRGIKFMFPNPNDGSTCKRMNLFLRWMVRRDELDFGLWNEIATSKLIIPVDTHIAKICKQLKLTKRNSVNWAMAEEITENLKKIDSDDPVKYDFALCHIGMRKLKF